jgi:hypothetical protein
MIGHVAIVPGGAEAVARFTMAKSKTPRPSTSLSKDGKPSASELLDELLPLAEPTAPEVHIHAAVLEVGDPAQLLELAADTALRPFLLCRLAPAVALVDPGRADELAEVLLRRGYTPKILEA